MLGMAKNARLRLNPDGDLFGRYFKDLSQTAFRSEKRERVEFGEIVQGKGKTMKEYQLGQALVMNRMNGEPAEESGIAVLKRDGEKLVVTAAMTDSDIFNTAQKKNERTWTTGDALEFFFQPAGREDYFELHVTPNEQTLELHIPGVEQLRIIPFEKQFFDSGFKYSAEVLDGQWKARMEIPFSAFGISEVKGARFTICRYNWNKKWEEPELTTISLFTNGTFHSPDEWFTIQ